MRVESHRQGPVRNAISQADEIVANLCTDHYVGPTLVNGELQSEAPIEALLTFETHEEVVGEVVVEVARALRDPNWAEEAIPASDATCKPPGVLSRE